MRLLAGDIGGTKTDLAIFEVRNGLLCLETEEKYPSQQYNSLDAIVLDFLSKNKSPKIDKACFGIAGAVKHGICKATNLPWIVNEKTIADELGIHSLKLINDLESNAYGLRVLNQKDFYLINEGEEDPSGNQALVSAGTGLGEAGIYFDGKHHRPLECEGGHCDFAPRNDEEIELFRYLKRKYDHVSFERILSGAGLVNLYHYYIEVKKEGPVFHEGVNEKDLSKKISERALSGKCPLSEKILTLFSSIYGSEAGNTALKFYALGGVYIGGGIAPKILKFLKNKVFLESFVNKGRFRTLLSKIPIQVILNEKTALLGSAYYAQHFMR